MTLESTTVKDTYSGDDSTVSFPITFAFWDDTDIDVTHRGADGTETTWTDGTQYTLSGGDGSTGTLTVSTAPTDYTPASSETLVILSNRDDKQATSFPLGGNFPSTASERALDQTVRLVQQKAEESDRTFKVSKTVTDNPDLEISELLVDRAGKYVRFDTGGDLDLVSIAGTDGIVLLDEDDMASESETQGVTQQSLVEYAKARAIYVTDPAFGAKVDGVTDDGAAILAAAVYAKELRDASTLTTVYIVFPPGNCKTSIGLPLAQGMGYMGLGLQGSNIEMTGSGAALYTATFAAGVFTDNLDATLNEVQIGTKDAPNTAILGIHFSHTGTISGNAPSGAAWQGVVDIVGAPAIRVQGCRASSQTDNKDGFYFKYCWKGSIKDFQVARGGAYSGGHGLYIDSTCNNFMVDHPNVFGGWDVGIRSTNPFSVTIIEPNVELTTLGIHMGGSNPRIIGGYFEGNGTDIRLGTVGGFAATDWLLQHTWHNGSASDYAIDPANCTKGRCIRPEFTGTYDVSEFYPRTIANGNVGNFIEISVSDASSPGLAALGLDDGRNLVHVYGVDYDDHRGFEAYKTSDQKTAETRTLNAWGNALNSFLLEVTNDTGTLKANHWALDGTTVPVFDDMFETRPAALTAVPTVSAGVGFGTSMSGVLSGSKHVLILNTADTTIVEACGVASLCFNDDGTGYLVLLGINSRDINGATRSRPEFKLSNATSGVDVDWDSIGAGKTLNVSFMGFFKSA